MKNRLRNNRTLRDIVPRYYAGFIVAVCGVILFNTIVFFVIKSGEDPNVRFFVGFGNNTLIIELACSIFGPIILLGDLLQNCFERNYMDIMSSVPEKRARRAGTVIGFLVGVYLLFAVLGIIVDLILAGFAADGFSVNGYLVRKYGLLACCYVLSLGIGLIAFAGASKLFEYAKNALLYLFSVFVFILLGFYLANIRFGTVNLRERFGRGRPLYFAEEFRETVLDIFMNRMSDGNDGHNAVQMILILAPIALLLVIIGYILFCRRPAEMAEGMSRCEWSHMLNQGLTIFLLSAWKLWEEINLQGGQTEVLYLSRKVFGNLNPLYAFCEIFCGVCIVQLGMEAFRRQNIKLCYKAWKGIVVGIIFLIVFALIFRKNAIDSSTYGWAEFYYYEELIENGFF